MTGATAAGRAAEQPLCAHLRVHSEYSISAGMLRLGGDNDVGALAAQRGIGALALTDDNNLFGAIKFYRSCVRAQVKPILGCQIRMAYEDMPEFRAVLLAANAEGFASMSRLLSRAQKREDRCGVVDADLLDKKSARGLIMLSGYEGEAGAAMRNGSPREASEAMNRWHERLGPGGYLCELSLCGREDEDVVAEQLASAAHSAGVPAVAAHPAMFPNKSDFESHDVRTCIAHGWRFQDEERLRLFSPDQYLFSADELDRKYGERFSGALENAAEVARRCNYDFAVGSDAHLPKIKRDGEDPAELLDQQCREGLERLPKKAASKKEYYARLRDELEVIRSKGYSDYFLIVADFVNFARENGIPVGPGRGSGAGSLAAHALGITGIDPLEYGLLFERFLNPERLAMPDFDVDFCMERRDEIIARARAKYGEDSVSQIATFGRLKARAVVRDVGRVLGLPYGKCDDVARLIPAELNATLDKARREVDDLDQLISGDPELTAMWEHARNLEGLPRNVSTHAGGVLIASRPLTEFCPLMRPAESGTQGMISQYDKDDVESVGLVKFDFLGLRTLTVIDLAVRMIAKHGRASFSEQDLRLDDEKTYRVYQTDDTVGIFQCEAAGMRDVMRRMQPKTLEDVAALISLYRPGPIESGMTKDFLERVADSSKIRYPHSSAEPILSSTYGTIVYQEQVMQIAQVLAGYTLGQADILRKAMGKKDPQVMSQQRDNFVKGAEPKLGRDDAEKMFDAIMKFAGYAFNKSHAVAYAVLSVRTAYLKTHYPAAFYAAIMTANFHDTEQLSKLIDDAKRHDIGISPPDVNSSDWCFAPETKSQVRYGLAAIKGVGRRVAEEVAHKRAGNGKFRSLADLCAQVPAKLFTRKTIENLVRAGACDSLVQSGCIGEKRARLFAGVSAALDEASELREHANQDRLFGGDKEPPERADTGPVRRWLAPRRLQEELQALGMTVSGSIYKAQSWLLENYRIISLQRVEEGVRGLWAGNISRIITPSMMRKRGMELFIIDDGENRPIEMRAVRGILDKSSPPKVGTVVLVEGEVKRNQRMELQLCANRVTTLLQLCSDYLESAQIDATMGDGEAFASMIAKIQQKGKGRSAVHINLQHQNKKCEERYEIKDRSLDVDLLTELYELHGYKPSLRYSLPPLHVAQARSS